MIQCPNPLEKIHLQSLALSICKIFRFREQDSLCLNSLVITKYGKKESKGFGIFGLYLAYLVVRLLYIKDKSREK